MKFLLYFGTPLPFKEGWVPPKLRSHCSEYTQNDENIQEGFALNSLGILAQFVRAQWAKIPNKSCKMHFF